MAGALKKRSARMVFLDMMGAEQGYGDGLMRGAAGVDLLWQLGIEPAEISRHADYGILGYARDPERVRFETREYRAVLDEGSSLRVVLRPGMPDCDSSDNLRAKVDAATAEGASSVDFYHQGYSSERSNLEPVDTVRPRAGVHYPRSAGEFRSWFGTDADCLDYLDWLRWPQGFRVSAMWARRRVGGR